MPAGLLGSRLAALEVLGRDESGPALGNDRPLDGIMDEAQREREGLEARDATRADRRLRREVHRLLTAGPGLGARTRRP